MNVAVFGDLHGKILLAWLLGRRWQQERGEALDALLCVGDVGIFPSEDAMDSATRRFLRQDRAEAGFMDSFALPGSDPLVEQVLAEVRADLYFVRGNHEDFDYLESCLRSSRHTAPVDAQGRLHYLPDGARVTLDDGRDLVTVTGLGGMGQGYRNPSRRHRLAFIRPEGLNRALEVEQATVLLTHEAPLLAARGDQGSLDVTTLIELTRPAFHFSGHLHRVLEECRVGPTRSFGLSDLSFAGGRLEPGGFGLLRWRDGAGEFELVDEPWLSKVQEKTWRWSL